MELAAAYPAAQATVPDLTYVRKVILKKTSNTVVLEDRTNAEDVILNFITYEKPVILSDGKISIGTTLAAFEGAELLTTETLPITDARLKTAWDHDLYRIRLRMSGTDFKLIIKEQNPTSNPSNPLLVGEVRSLINSNFALEQVRSLSMVI